MSAQDRPLHLFDRLSRAVIVVQRQCRCGGGTVALWRDVRFDMKTMLADNAI